MLSGTQEVEDSSAPLSVMHRIRCHCPAIVIFLEFAQVLPRAHAAEIAIACSLGLWKPVAWSAPMVAAEILSLERLNRDSFESSCSQFLILPLRDGR